MDVYQRRRLVALSAVAAVFILIVLLVRSCGGDEEEPTAALTAPVSGATGAGGALSQDDYITQADEICLQANTALAGVDEADAEQAATDKGDILAGELEQLQTLAPPEEDADTLDNFLNALNKQVKAYGDQATAAQRGDDATVAELDTAIGNLATKAQEAGADYGFEVCGDTTKTDEGGGGGGDSSTTGDTTDTGGTVTPATTTPTATTPAPTETPAPSEGGTVTPTPTPTPAPSDGSSSGGTGGVTP